MRGLPYVWGGNGTGGGHAGGQPLLPGYLGFYGTPTNIHHVGLYISDDYAGATRPAASIAV